MLGQTELRADPLPQHIARPRDLRRPRARRLVSSFLVIACLLAFLPEGTAKSRRAARRLRIDLRVESILREMKADRGFWGVEVVRLDDGKTLYTRNANHLFQPASNMKLFTTAAAIEKLGPDFIFRTTVESEAAPDAEGRVGDMVLVGRGDPNLSDRVLPYRLKTERQGAADAVFQELAAQVSSRQVREVQGNVVADDRYFLYEPFGRDWSADDLLWAYAPPVTALAFNDNALLLRIYAASRVGERATVSLDPIPDYYEINNRVETAAANTQIFVERLPGSSQLDVWGQVPLGAMIHEDPLAIDNPPELAGKLLARALEARGIHVRGRVVVRRRTPMDRAASGDYTGQTPPRVVLAEHRSLPLREDIKVINKVSENLHAEMLLRTMGRELKACGCQEGGLKVLEEFNAEVGILPEETHLVDGSGLSRDALITPRAVVMLLEYMARSPRFEVFFDSLPVAGVDGTLADRLQSSRAAGQIHAKTGSIEHTNSLAGYMDLPSGERLAFSIVGNCHNLKPKEALRTVDRIAVAIYEKYGGHK